MTRTFQAPVFIVGCPRSGTTLLRDLLRSHPRLTFPYESGVLPVLYRRRGDPASDRAARRLAADLLGGAGIARWALDLRPADLQHHRSFAALAGALFEAWARREGKPRWGDKTPLYATELPTIRRIWPDARVVHIVRDGRDVACSLLRQPWGPASVHTAALMWTRTVAAAGTAGRAIGPGAYHELRYEALVSDPEPALRSVCEFLGEDFDPALLHPARLPPPPGRRAPWTERQASAIDRGGVEEWRSALSQRDRAAFAAVGGELLAKLGYPPAGPGRSPGLALRLGWQARDAAAGVRWQATTWDRGPRLRERVLLARAGANAIARGARTARAG